MTYVVGVAQSGTRRHGAAENTALAAVCGPEVSRFSIHFVRQVRDG